MVPPALLFYLSSAEFPSPRLESYIHVEEQLFTTRLKNFRLSPPGTSVCSHCNSFSLWKSWSTVPFAMASSGRLGVEQLQTQQICIVFLEDVEYVQALHTESFFGIIKYNQTRHIDYFNFFLPKYPPPQSTICILIHPCNALKCGQKVRRDGRISAATRSTIHVLWTGAHTRHIWLPPYLPYLPL